MGAKRLPYREGSVFLVPLRSGRLGRGVVARSGPRGKLLLGYFFGPKLEVGQAPLGGLRPEDAVLIVRFGDLGLFRGEWKVIGQIEPWSRSDWPIPEFLWTDPLGVIRDKVIVYTDANFDQGGLGREERRETIPPGLQRDGVSGSGAVEIKLSNILG
jgi:hypothetical protein